MTQDGTNTSIYGLCITGALTIAAHITLNDWQLVLTICAILAAISTIAINVKNFFKKNK